MSTAAAGPISEPAVGDAAPAALDDNVGVGAAEAEARYAAVLAASTGATLAELMARLGHTTPGAALRYQHAAQGRDRVIAAALSDLVAGHVTPIDTAHGTKRKNAAVGV